MSRVIRFFPCILLAVISISCNGLINVSQQQVVPTKVTPTISIITPSKANTAACTESAKKIKSDGWECLNQSYGFSIHLPATAKITQYMIDGVVEIRLQNSPVNLRIERSLLISIEQPAEWCFPPDDEKIQIGKHGFLINDGSVPSRIGTLDAWRSYAIAKGPKKVCFDFVFSFREYQDPFFPPEEEQGLDDVESILATFQWLEP